jgi:hypothetical protein
MKAIELHEQVNSKIKEICQLLIDGREKYKLSVTDLTEKCILDLANYGGYNHYESLGILEEAKLNYRQISHDLIEQELFEEEHFPITIDINDFPQRELRFNVCASQLDEPSNMDNRTKLFHNYLVQNDIDPIIGDVEDWVVIHVEITDEGELWSVSN